MACDHPLFAPRAPTFSQSPLAHSSSRFSSGVNCYLQRFTISIEFRSDRTEHLHASSVSTREPVSDQSLVGQSDTVSLYCLYPYLFNSSRRPTACRARSEACYLIYSSNNTSSRNCLLKSCDHKMDGAERPQGSDVQRRM